MESTGSGDEFNCLVENTPSVKSAVVGVGKDDRGGEAEEENTCKVLEAPCIICFKLVVGVADKSKIFEPVTQQEKDDYKLWNWFLINFRSFIKKKKRKGVRGGGGDKKQVERFDQLFKNRTIGWDSQGGKSPPLPFCEECKAELNGLMGKMSDFEDLEKRVGREDVEGVKEGMTEVRRKMGRCEGEFLESGIYEKDKRYQRVRRYIINITSSAQGYRKKGKDLEDAGVEEVGEGEVVGEEEDVGVEVPCIICCETVKRFEKGEGGLSREGKRYEDGRIFTWFLNNFKRPSTQVLFGTRKRYLEGEGTSDAWDGKWGASEPLQFCGGCRGEVMEYFGGMGGGGELMRRRRVKWVQVTRERMREAEDRFEESGIYERDWRYFNVRWKVIKVVEQQRSLLKEVPKEKMKRGRKRKVVGEEKKEGEEPRVRIKIVEERTGIPEIDNILEERFRKILPRPSAQQQVVRVVVKQEEKMEDGVGEEGEEEEEPPIIQVKKEKDDGEEGMDPLGPDTGALEEVEGPHHRNCLLCYKAMSKEESALAPVLTNDLNELNFNSVFILRKMLNVPKERLTGYLENFGCPGKWVEYCKNCLYLVDAALRIQKEISELEDKLKKCQEKMVQKIKSSFNSKKNGSPEEGVYRVTEETRQFVNLKSISGKKRIENSGSQAASAGSPPEVTSDADKDADAGDNGPVEYPSAPPSPPDNFDLDPSYVDNKSPPEQEVDQELEPKPRSPEKLKLSREAKALIKSRAEASAIDRQYLKTLKSGDHTCSRCPNTLKKPMSLIKFYRHLIFHAQRPFKCNICNIYWSSSAELEKNPFKKESPPSNSEHVCSEETLEKIAGAGAGVEEDGKFNAGKIWECTWCSEKFEKEKERDSHEKKEHTLSKNVLVRKYKCLSCDKAYRNFKEWLLHRVLDHPWIAMISCLFCDYTAVKKTKEGIDILNLTEMRKHLSLKHPPSCINFYVNPETCDFCGATFKFGKDNLSKHLKDEHKLTSGLLTYKCPCCYYRTHKLAYLREHLNCRHLLTPREKPPCKQYEYKKKYAKTKAKVICDVCGTVLRSGLVLMEHKMREHGVDPKEMPEYTGQKIYKCDAGAGECGGYRTLKKDKMEEHMIKRHGMETRWRCEECGKGFCNASHLGRHKDIHKNKGLKPHQCEICGNSFAVKNYLYIHKRLSHQNRPFASTNRKRTTKRGSKVNKTIGMPPTPISSGGEVLNRESIEFRKDGG